MASLPLKARQNNYDTQHKGLISDTQHNDTQHKGLISDTQHNDIQHKGLISDTQRKRHSAYMTLGIKKHSESSVIMLSVILQGVIMLSVIMLSIIMLNVVAPNSRAQALAPHKNRHF